MGILCGNILTVSDEIRIGTIFECLDGEGNLLPENIRIYVVTDILQENPPYFFDGQRQPFRDGFQILNGGTCSVDNIGNILGKIDLPELRLELERGWLWKGIKESELPELMSLYNFDESMVIRINK